MKQASSDQKVIFFIALNMPERKGQNTNLQNFGLHCPKLETYFLVNYCDSPPKKQFTCDTVNC